MYLIIHHPENIYGLTPAPTPKRVRGYKAALREWVERTMNNQYVELLLNTEYAARRAALMAEACQA